jgi:predicted nucleotidyltransferase
VIFGNCFTLFAFFRVRVLTYLYQLFILSVYFIEHMPQILDFLSPTALKVLDYFFAHPTEQFHEREVLRATGVSKGSANRILRIFARLSILERTEKGRMVFYRLNTGDPFVKLMKAAENAWVLRPFIEGLKASARKIILFGSCAEGTDGTESDIDILILTDNRKSAKDKVSAFNQKSERAMAPIIVDMDEFAMMRKDDEPLFERIDRGITLWETV